MVDMGTVDYRHKGKKFQIAVHQQGADFYATWTCQACLQHGTPRQYRPAADKALAEAKVHLASHHCPAVAAAPAT